MIARNPHGSSVLVTDVQVGDEIYIADTFATGRITDIKRCDRRQDNLHLYFALPAGMSIKPNRLTLQTDEKVVKVN
jgi:hypothetical protein